MTYFNRILPALILMLSAPLIAEFLLGDFNIRQFAYMGIFVPLYGGGALLIREIARRAGRGWWTMMLLGLAYAFVLEGFVNQTMLNPNYMGQHMLKYGFISYLGTSFNYDIFILTLHVVWSVCTPIALAEGLAGKRAYEPWLNRIELGMVVLLTILGVVGTTIGAYKSNHFIASPMQYVVVGVLMMLAVLLAFKMDIKQGTKKVTGSNQLSYWVVLLAMLVLSSLFQFWFHYAPKHVAPLVGIAVFVVIDVLVVWLLVHYSRKVAVDDTTTSALLALSAGMGAILTYAWFGMRRFLNGASAMGIKTQPIDIAGQVGLILLFVALGWLAYTKIKKQL